MDNLSYDDVSTVLRADLVTGELYWLPRTPDMFEGSSIEEAKDSCDAWNAEFSGEKAITSPHIKGYRVVRILGHTHLVHRVIWLLATGAWPENQVDHVNGVKDDNRIENLRDVTNAENSKNQGRYSNNKSGVTGVLWHKGKAKWRSQIRVNGREFHLGYFSDFDDAVSARKDADIRFGFHENHGRVATIAA